MAEQSANHAGKDDNVPVLLVSSDNVEFEVTFREAKCSRMLKRMLEGSAFVESQNKRVQLPTISSEVLAVIIKVSGWV